MLIAQLPNMRSSYHGPSGLVFDALMQGLAYTHQEEISRKYSSVKNILPSFCRLHPSLDSGCVVQHPAWRIDEGK